MFSLKFGFLNFNFQIFCWVNDPNLSLRLHRQIKENPSRWQFACLLFSSHEIDILLVVEIHGKLYRPSRMVGGKLHFTSPPIVSSVACWEWGIVFTISLKVSFFLLFQERSTLESRFMFLLLFGKLRTLMDGYLVETSVRCCRNWWGTTLLVYGNSTSEGWFRWCSRYARKLSNIAIVPTW